MNALQILQLAEQLVAALKGVAPFGAALATDKKAAIGALQAAEAAFEADESTAAVVD